MSTTFSIDVIDPHIVTLPNPYNDLAPVTYVGGRMRITSDDVLVCEWDEDDVETALNDFVSKVTFPLADDLSVDIYHYEGNNVDVSVWAGPDESQVAWATTSDTAFHAAVARTMAEVAVWRHTR